jgi:Arc/MetJ family transcription regulator
LARPPAGRRYANHSRPDRVPTRGGFSSTGNCVRRRSWLPVMLPGSTRDVGFVAIKPGSAPRIDCSTKLCHLMCEGSHMATNLSIDPELLERALEVSGERTKKAAVTKALEEFIARRRQKRLLDLMGKLEWDEGFDYKVERSRR